MTSIWLTKLASRGRHSSIYFGWYLLAFWWLPPKAWASSFYCGSCLKFAAIAWLVFQVPNESVHNNISQFTESLSDAVWSPAEQASRVRMLCRHVHERRRRVLHDIEPAWSPTQRRQRRGGHIRPLCVAVDLRRKPWSSKRCIEAVHSMGGTHGRPQKFFQRGATSTFCLSLSGFNANRRLQNSLKIHSRTCQGKMSVLSPLRTPMAGYTPWQTNPRPSQQSRNRPWMANDPRVRISWTLQARPSHVGWQSSYLCFKSLQTLRCQQ